MPNLVPTDVHVNQLVENFGLKYVNKKWINERVFPIVGVKNKTGLYPSYPISAWMRDEAQPTEGLAPAGSFNIDLTPSFRNVTYKWATPLTDETVANADSVLKITMSAAEYSMNKIMMARERRVAAIVFTAAASTTWTGYTTLTAAAGTQWDNSASATPATDIITGMNTVTDNTFGAEANTLIFGSDAWKTFSVHPEIIAICYGGGWSGPRRVTVAKVAEAFGIQNVLIGNAAYTADQEGTSEGSVTYTKIWGKHAWLGYVAPSPAGFEPTAGVQPRNMFKTWTWRDVGAETSYVQAQESIDELALSTRCGYYIFEATA